MKAVKGTIKALAISSLMGLSMGANAAPMYDLSDNYIGGDDHGHGDVIGANSLFDVKGLNVSQSGSWLTVDIFTNFAKKKAIGSYDHLTYNSQGIGSGDLFLSNTYTPYGTDSNGYLYDNANNGNFWTYGLALDNPYSEVGGSATLYALEGQSNDENTLLSDDFLKQGIFRNGQEVAVDESSSSVRQVNSTGSWSVDLDNNKISFLFDTRGTDLLDNDSLALHWGMMCGNDVIEGTVNVSEPGTAALLGLGLLGLAASRRRFS